MNDEPLAGRRVVSAPWPAARLAGRMLAGLGASVTVEQRPPGDDLALESESESESGSGSWQIRRSPTTAAVDWVDSGLVELCGRADGPPLEPVGRPATLARAAGLAIDLLASGLPPVRAVRTSQAARSVDPVSRLGERAPRLGLTRAGAVSAGGAARLLRTQDGWLVLNLPRPADRDLVPALVEGPVGDDHWAALRRWVADRPTGTVLARCLLLGLAAGSVPPPPSRPGVALSPAPWVVRRWPGEKAPDRPGPLRVVNLGSLWAAPLCAHLLHGVGLSVVDVESASRRESTPVEFYRTLHAGHELRVLDFDDVTDRARLVDLIRSADVVIEASRPRALRALGLSAGQILADGPARVWLRITGHGADVDRVAFGDDAAADAGLVAWDARGPVFAGDAIADPLTGLVSAMVVLACLRAGGTWSADLNLREVARSAAQLTDDL